MADQFDDLYATTEAKAAELEAAVATLESEEYAMAAELATFMERQQAHHDRLDQARADAMTATRALQALRGAREAIGTVAATAQTGAGGKKGA